MRGEKKEQGRETAKERLEHREKTKNSLPSAWGGIQKPGRAAGRVTSAKDTRPALMRKRRRGVGNLRAW